MTPLLKLCLRYFLRTRPDFGSVYGYIRPYWGSDLTSLPETLSRQEERDSAMRREAVEGDYIRNARIPPRRIWDLYSNRVIPYHAINQATQDGFPDTLWTVSHSWVEEDQRDSVVTKINSKAWPVPIPRTTTLDHVRVELLNYGAQYVWIDVLCLRQVGQEKDEAQRMEEWELDIPTIGHIYSGKEVPCITYFNGLGLPFDPSDEALESERHWLQRVWTVQETTEHWLPGGLMAASTPQICSFFQDRHGEAVHHQPSSDIDDSIGGTSTTLSKLAHATKLLRTRHCTIELDRVSSLAYLAQCETRPIYRTALDAESAWAILLKHLPDDVRGVIAMRHARRRPTAQTVLPTWSQFLREFAEWDMSRSRKFWDTYEQIPEKSRLCLVDSSQLGTAEPGKYCQDAYCSAPFVVPMQGPDGPIGAALSMDFAFSGDVAFPEEVTFTLHGYAQGSRDTQFQLQGVADGPWYPGRSCILLQRTVKTAIILKLLAFRMVNGRMTAEVLRCGNILVDWKENFPKGMVRIIYHM
ncbi:hypothetical protein PsYK624_143850 [Phanerochaete sordida]|uniref:Heterokaryon incompatibility domain-containing protein n=1 Tax=Phanerochaete sordida TaxID=48140 RepID=A0A9P3GLT6_9APHY|nr:hypothetical protein PsYK624_143850 [Phanerochaete sordida]